MRKVIDFNTGWRFSKIWNDGIKTDIIDSQKIALPHTVYEVPLHYFDEKEMWLITGYQNVFKYNKKESETKRILIHFEGVMAATELFVNSKSFGEHKGGYTPFTYDITDVLKEGDNIIALKIDSRERDDIPPFGGEIDYLTYGGIYREVQIIIVDDISIEKAMITGLLDNRIFGKIRIRNSKQIKKNENMIITLLNEDFKICEITKSFELKNDIFTDVNIDSKIDYNNIELWDTENPKLYNLHIKLGGDELSIKIGFRETKFTEDGFFLNGNRIKLIGLNRHQSYPFLGYAMPKRIQKKDADILRFDIGLNFVRSSHYPPSRHFLDRCDEIGLLVFEEIPGWQHIGNKAWQEISIQNLEDMIERDFHHPSIIIWGVRINESPDNHSFYKKTNEISKKKDKTRQTGGVRCIEGSELLEDVYMMNDFNYNGLRDPIRSQKEVTKLDYNVPYMITEYNGHMYPTKMQDGEERQMEHTLRHYKIINSVVIDDHISGSTGWCAFDYHTHCDFGSGDKICYHGVYDMFRNPKFASSAYISQISPNKKIVMEAITIYTRGERAVGGIFPLVISTNCDYVEFYYGGNLLTKAYPAKGKFQGLKYPPIIIDLPTNIPGVSDIRWSDAAIIGYVDGKKVIEKKYLKNPTFSALEIISDDDTINAVRNGSSWDSTRITVKAVDSYGNRLPYINEAVNIKVEGAGELIGEDNPVLEGGLYSFWVRTKEKKGTIKITVENKRVESRTVEIYVK